MKIYSWNVLFRNKELDRVFAFIRDTEFDIFCLQEVPGSLLEQLKQLPLTVAAAIDVEKILDRGVVPIYNVILTRYPLVHEGTVAFPEYWSLLPLRTRLFVQLMPEKFFSKIRNRRALYADVLVHDTLVRVFNLHLILAHPTWRLTEFETAMAERDPSRPTIVCGDFNTIEAPHMMLLNWLLGGKLSDAFFHRRERTRIEQQFVEHELQNALQGSVTHPLSRSQLDHILLSHSFSIRHAAVLPESIGSDHHPIYVETTS